ncbi:hypothetical protein ADIWIN_3880 [Winogradskyella psychrotolerans RS-3]|uniref:Lipoprotein n=1 Tax=Winogradskyella psychrotolerans RS-3 TaxID=641526 RepID=S7VKH0_9FLAO|nr:hypothetical protein [Winogradskyella psychrotolerans]EPR70017.1 hypothetical protein ADIWIN_3880 [Winogradskyella psychrotolerans RS-3]
MKRFLIINLCSLFLFTSCAIPTVKGLSEYDAKAAVFSNPYFSNTNIDYVYKAKIKAYNNDFGGILIIKKIKENNHRIVFTTNFGNKIFDFELINNEMKTHFIMKELDRKIIINTLKRDFQTLTQEHNTINKAFTNNDGNIIYQSKNQKRFNHYLINQQSQQLTKIINTTHSKEKIIISFSNVKNTIAEHIKIEHKTAPIQIDLTYLNHKE